MDNKNNTGHNNSGYSNSGYSNSGDYNSGNSNSGYSNSGNHNSGYSNSGDNNSGHNNSGYRNSGNYNSGICNTDTPKVRLFNKESLWEFKSDAYNKFLSIIRKYSKPLCEFISESNMTNKEKEEYSTYRTTGGYLKVNKDLYNDKEITKEDKDFILSVPNFDKDIFLETTGIDIDGNRVKIIIDGKEILISKDSFNELKKQLT